MKNIHLISTDKPSRLHLGNSGLVLCDFKFGKNTINGQNIYITSDKIEKEDWCLDLKTNKMFKAGLSVGDEYKELFKKIILTTDQDLIKDGVQPIDDEFLEWFVKNRSCEEVEVVKEGYKKNDMIDEATSYRYKIIIPKEEPKIMNNCPKCGLDLIKREGSTPVCTRIDCSGIILSNETLKEWSSTEEPKQYPIGGYAPGYYSCTCVTCKKEFTGDKRAVQCEPCAIEMVSIKIVKNNDSYQIEEPKQETLTYTEAAKKEERIFNSTMMSNQETLEEAAERYAHNYFNMHETNNYKALKQGYEAGAKEMAERMYSESDKIMKFLNTEKELKLSDAKTIERIKWYFETYFEQFKKK